MKTYFPLLLFIVFGLQQLGAQEGLLRISNPDNMKVVLLQEQDRIQIKTLDKKNTRENLPLLIKIISNLEIVSFHSTPLHKSNHFQFRENLLPVQFLHTLGWYRLQELYCIQSQETPLLLHFL